MGLCSNSTVVLVAAFAALTGGWIQYSKLRWKSRIRAFRNRHHGYQTASNNNMDVLLIVNPASGAGKAMTIYDDCLQELEAQGYQVEVYVTESTHDMIALTETKDFSGYKRMIAVLAGDSSLFEFAQAAFHKNSGLWPYAPILHLPGGSSNVLSGEFHNRSTNIHEIVSSATTVKKGSVIKVSSPGATTRYALHNAFDGHQRLVIDAVEKRRGTLYAALGKPAIIFVVLSTILGLPFRSREELTPILLLVTNSDMEAEGINFGFGVNRFDDKMIVMHQQEYKGVGNVLKNMGKSLSGTLGKEFVEDKIVPEGMELDVCKRFTVEGAGHYRIYAEGSNSLPIEGEKVTFESVPNAVPYYVMV